MSRNFKSNCQYFFCYRSEKTPGTSFAFNLRTSTSKTPNLGARVGGANAILGHVHLENPKMALENMALNSLKWPLNQKY